MKMLEIVSRASKSRACSTSLLFCAPAITPPKTKIAATSNPHCLRMTTSAIYIARNRRLARQRSALHLLRPVEHLLGNVVARMLAAEAVFVRRSYEAREEGMRLQRLRLELRVELAAKEEWVFGNFDDFDIRSVGRSAADAKSAGG